MIINNSYKFKIIKPSAHDASAVNIAKKWKLHKIQNRNGFLWLVYGLLSHNGNDNHVWDLTSIKGKRLGFKQK